MKVKLSSIEDLKPGDVFETPVPMMFARISDDYGWFIGGEFYSEGAAVALLASCGGCVSRPKGFLGSGLLTSVDRSFNAVNISMDEYFESNGVKQRVAIFAEGNHPASSELAGIPSPSYSDQAAERPPVTAPCSKFQQWITFSKKRWELAEPREVVWQREIGFSEGWDAARDAFRADRGVLAEVRRECEMHTVYLGSSPFSAGLKQKSMRILSILETKGTGEAPDYDAKIQAEYDSLRDAGLLPTEALKQAKATVESVASPSDPVPTEVETSSVPVSGAKPLVGTVWKRKDDGFVVIVDIDHLNVWWKREGVESMEPIVWPLEDFFCLWTFMRYAPPPPSQEVWVCKKDEEGNLI